MNDQGLDEIPTNGPHSRIETLISDDQIVSTLKMINVEAKSRPGVYSCEMIFVNGASEDRTEIPEPAPIRGKSHFHPFSLRIFGTH